MKKNDRNILVLLIISFSIPLALYFVDIYLLDPIAPDAGWLYRVTNLFVFSLGFGFVWGMPLFFVMTTVYHCIQHLKTRVKRKTLGR